MSNLNSCARCKAELRPQNSGGLCTRCLLESGLEESLVEPHLPQLGQAQPFFIGPADWTARSFGDYELVEEIARGGMGVVYRARQLSLDRIVALKMILAGPFASDQIIQRFRDEVTAAALLQHPNIVAIHDVGIHDGQHYFSMDYVEGRNLSQLVANRPLPPAKAARYVKLIAEAIHYAHEQGILHRDLKPSNILVDATDQPRITDFGLAKRLDGDGSITLTGQMLGSPNFMPPEQASSQRGKVSRPSDVYGLGAILYHLLTARPPFQAESIQSLIHQVLNTEPVSPRLLNSSVPSDLETICVKCLQKEPSRRYQSAHELADELDRFLRGEPIQARPVSRAERTWRWCRRKPAIASLSAVTFLLLLAVAIGSPMAAFRINRERQRAEHERERAEENLYNADMHGAESAWEDGDLGRARELVEAHWPQAGQVDLRDFAWRLLWRRCRGDNLYTLRGYANALNSVRFSPDGNTLLTRSQDNHLKVWDLTTRTERFTITNVTTLGEYTSDGLRFACGTGDGSVRLFDPRTGETLHSLQKAGEFVALLHDGKTVATTAEEFVVKLWDISSGRETFVLPGKGGMKLLGTLSRAGVVVTPDGKKVAISNGFEKGVTLWDLATHTVLNRSLDERQNIPLTFLQLSPDGRVLATGGLEGLVRFWDMATGQELLPALQAHSEPVFAAAFSPDGQVLATASLDQTIKLWDFATRGERDTLQGHESGVRAVTFSADGRRLASGGLDKTVRLWNTERKRAKSALPGLAHGVGQTHALVWSPDSSLLAAHCHDRSVKVWEVATLETRVVLPGASGVLRFSNDGKAILTRFGARTLKYCDAATGKVTQEIPLLPLADWNSLTISPDGRTVAIADATPMVRLWDIASGKVVLLTGQNRAESVVEFSPDGHTLINGGLDGVIDVWNVGRRQYVMPMAAHLGEIRSVAISPDGAIVASATTDNVIKLWNLKTGRLLATLNGHKRPVWALAFSPDGKTLASGSGDHSIRLWNVPLRREVAILRPFTSTHPGVPEEISSLSFSPDGDTLGAVTEGGVLTLLRAATLHEMALRSDAAQAQPNAAQ